MMTDDERKAWNKANSERRKRWWNSMSPEERRERRRRYAENQARRLAKLAAEESA